MALRKLSGAKKLEVKNLVTLSLCENRRRTNMNSRVSPFRFSLFISHLCGLIQAHVPGTFILTFCM
jgi:hypothetical protein